MDRTPNVALSRHLRDAGWSDKGTARRVNAERAARRRPTGYAGANVRGWRHGVVPEPATRAVLAHLLTAALGRRITERDLGFPAPRPVIGGLTWPASPIDSLADLAVLWHDDGGPRTAALDFAPDGYTAPVRDFLLDWPDDDVSHLGRRRVGRGEVDVLWQACASYQDLERRLGGGHVRSGVRQLLVGVVAPLVHGSYPDDVGRALLAVCARLTDILGYAAYDALEQGLAQRYLIQALRLARAAGDDALAAHILGDMARQAVHAGEPREAVALARAGRRAARTGDSPGDVARSACVEAVACAMLGDHAAATAAMHAAEAAAAVSPTPRPWIGYFTADQVLQEFVHVELASGRPQRAARRAASLVECPGLERRAASLAVAVARAHLEIGDVEGAHAAASRALDLTAAMASRRIAEETRAVCTEVATRAPARPSAELLHRSRTALGAA